MKEYIQKNKIMILTLLFCLITSIVVLLTTSENSPLYPMNDWVDVNAFFTVGKGMFNGNIPYKDLFEQKGPILYLIYGIGYFITNKAFLGVFILEVISFTTFLYFCQKIIKLFTKGKYGLILLPLLATLICTCRSFSHGGSAEEFCFPYLAISLYYFLKYLLDEKHSYKIILFNGLLAGIVLLIKFTLLGFWFAFMMIIFLILISKGEYKKAIKSCLVFLLGMVIPFILVSLYFLINKGFKDFIDIYFVANLFNYGKKSVPILARIMVALSGFIAELNNNGLIIFTSFMGIIFFIKNMKVSKLKKWYVGLAIIISILFVYIGNLFFRYYLLILVPFILLTLIELIKYYEKYIKKIMQQKYFYIIYIGYLAFLMLFSINFANYREMLGVSKDTLIQYKFAKIINQEKEATVLNYRSLDNGVYFSSNLVHNPRFFQKLNFSYDSYPANYLEQDKYIASKKTMFVVLRMDKSKPDKLNSIYPNLFLNYNLISSGRQRSDGKMKYYYLFKTKNA